VNEEMETVNFIDETEMSALVCGASVESIEGDFLIEASMDNWPPLRRFEGCTHIPSE
jgi:hypothetical protein